MEAQIFLVIAGIILAGFIVSRFFTKKARIKRKLKKAELKKLTNFKNGDVAKIVGTVEIIGTPLIAPLSGRECSVYYIHIEERVSSGKSATWKTRVKEEISSKYVIREGNNCAYINAPAEIAVAFMAEMILPAGLSTGAWVVAAN